MTIENPFHNPTTSRDGNVVEILESLTDEELRAYGEHLRWEQSHRIFSNANVYLSRSYYCYRSDRWLETIYELLTLRQSTSD